MTDLPDFSKLTAAEIRFLDRAMQIMDECRLPPPPARSFFHALSVPE